VPGDGAAGLDVGDAPDTGDADVVVVVVGEVGLVVSVFAASLPHPAMDKTSVNPTVAASVRIRRTPFDRNGSRGTASAQIPQISRPNRPKRPIQHAFMRS
jgi:hypothetical protein